MRTLAILCILLAGCGTTRHVVEIPPVPLPEFCEGYEYPRIPAAELEPLSDAAYEALVVRDETKSAQIDRLCNIIRAHNRQ